MQKAIDENPDYVLFWNSRLMFLPTWYWWKHLYMQACFACHQAEWQKQRSHLYLGQHRPDQ